MEKDNKNKGILSKIESKYLGLIEKCLTPKVIFIVLTVIYIAGLIPLFWIGRYNYPCADDYSFGAACRAVWVESYSIPAVLSRAAVRAWEYYLNWAGCMSSSFFMALQPAVFGEGVYRITPLIMIGIVSFGTVYFMHVLFVKGLKCSPYIIHSITMLMLFMMIQRMPEPAEGLFWYNGAVHYTFMHGVSLFFYGMLISAAVEKDSKKKRRSFIFSSIPAIIVGMGNYMTALNIGIVLAFLIFFLIINKKLKEQSFIFIPAGIFYLTFIINVIAPGNAVRETASNGMNPLKAVLVSFYYALDYCLGEWSGWELLVFIALVATFFWNACRNLEFSFSYPLPVVMLNYCILSAMITPPLFGTGNIEAGRIKSLIYIMYILLLTLTVCYVTGWARKRFAGMGASVEDGKGSSFSYNSKLVIGFGMLFFLFGAIICTIPKPDYFTFGTAAVDILNGNAAAYGEAMQERVEIYNASAGKDVEVEPLPVRPELLCTSDISPDSNDWVNLGVCRFYRLESVRVRITDND